MYRDVLGSVCDITMGQAPKGASYNKNGVGSPLIAGAGDFGELFPEASKFTTKPTKLSCPDEIILCIRATIGERNWADGVYCLGRGVAGLMARSDILDQRYLWHWLAHASPSLKAKGKGATFLQVSKADISSMEIPLPPLEEQRRIASILDMADALRAKRRDAIAKLDQLLQSVFLDMFGDPLLNDRGWDDCQLGDLIHEAEDGPHVSPSYSEDGIPFLSTRHIRNGKIQWVDLKYINKESAKVQWKKCRPEYGDVLYTKGGTTGLAAEVDTQEPFAVWVHVAVLKTAHNLANPTWLAAMLNTRYCYAQSQRYTHGIANRDLGLGRMKKIKMYKPPKTLQDNFAELSKSLRAKKKVYSASAEAFDKLFQAILQRAFTGQL